MCVVIDTNVIHLVFNPNSNDHEEFKPVLDWISDGSGKIVYGGKTYKNELKKMTKYFKIIKELKTAGKVVPVDDKKVDNYENYLVSNNQKLIQDPHLISIIEISGCKIVCTKDIKSIPFIKDNTLYNRVKKPKIYSDKRQAYLCCNKNMARCCQL